MNLLNLDRKLRRLNFLNIVWLLILLWDIFAQENSQRTNIENQLMSKQREKECLEQQITNQVMELRQEIQKVSLLLATIFQHNLLLCLRF